MRFACTELLALAKVNNDRYIGKTPQKKKRYIGKRKLHYYYEIILFVALSRFGHLFPIRLNLLPSHKFVLAPILLVASNKLVCPASDPTVDLSAIFLTNHLPVAGIYIQRVNNATLSI